MELVELYLKVVLGGIIFGFAVIAVGLIITSILFKKVWEEIKQAYRNMFK